MEAAFNRAHGTKATVGKTYVWEVMRDRAEQIHQRRREIKKRAPSIIAAGHTWALDLTVLRSPHGTTFTILAILDAGSRRLLRCIALPRKCTCTILAQVLLAVSEFGPPDVIRTDNEAMFTSRLWLATLKAMSIRARRGPPLQPWHNGRIERFWGTLKAALRGAALETVGVLQATLDRFAHFYNKVRPHQALRGLTPNEAWLGQTMADVQWAHAQGWREREAGELLEGFEAKH